MTSNISVTGHKTTNQCVGGTKKFRCMNKIPMINCKCENPNCGANKTRSSIEQIGSGEPFFEKPTKSRGSYDHTILNDSDNVLWNTKNADEYWCRSTLRTYPLVANASGILNNEIKTILKRETLSDGPKKYYQRRHFGILITKSYLDDYF